jgi:AraC-like DNA-binding protein
MLSTVHLSSTVFARTQLVAPWGIRAEAGEHFAFHVITRGRGWLEVDGMAPTSVEAGEVVVITPGRGHALRDRPQTTTRDLFEMLAAGEFTRPDSGPLPDGAEWTTLICGCFQLDHLPDNALLAALPPVIHIRETSSDVGPWLAQTITLLTYESHAERPGAATVVNRLCDALFVYILRSHLAALPENNASWLRALVDPQLGEALRAMHEHPATGWTVRSLAAGVGMSRSAFAARFAGVVGETPIQYLTRWRLQKAATMLQPGDADVSAAAASVGYESIPAFSKAFKRIIGVSPGAYRRGVRAVRADRAAL